MCCNDLKSGEDTNKTSDIVNTEEEEENSFWDSYEGEFDYESYDNRRNPCHRGILQDYFLLIRDTSFWIQTRLIYDNIVRSLRLYFMIFTCLIVFMAFLI
jgi:hypothetical protein